MRSPSSSPGSSTSTRCMWTPRVPLYSGLCFCSMYRWIRLVFPTARSPTTLIFSLRRRIRKALVSPPGGSKAHRGNYQTSPLPPAPPLLNASAPSAQRDALSEPGTRGLIAFVLSATSLVAALGLQFFGQRRRERFFAELGVA